MISQEPIKVTFVISTLAAGGAERVITTLINYWAEYQPGLNISIITIGSDETDFYDLHSRVYRKSLKLVETSRNPVQALYNNIKRIITLRKEINNINPQVLVSFGDRTNVLTILSCIGLGMSIIISERTDPRAKSIGIIWERIRRILYPFASAVVVQTHAVSEWACDFIAKEKVYVIPNPIKHEVNLEILPKDNKQNEFTLLAVGRLIKAKGFDLLIRAFAKSVYNCPNWKMMILGEGEERNNLERLVSEFKLDNLVSIPGIVKNPQSVMVTANLFVLSSRREGFPNSLLEAMVNGLPVISTDCPSGPSEIITNGFDGILVPTDDVNALAHALEELMINDQLRGTLAENAPKILSRYNVETIAKIWEELILKSLKKQIISS